MTNNTIKSQEVYQNNSYYMNLDQNILVKVVRVKNDINGNPLYRVYPVNFTDLKKLSIPVRRNFGEKYYLIQSYNIVATLVLLFNEMEQLDYFKNIPQFEKENLSSYKKVKAYYN